MKDKFYEVHDYVFLNIYFLTFEIKFRIRVSFVSISPFVRDVQRRILLSSMT